MLYIKSISGAQKGAVKKLAPLYGAGQFEWTTTVTSLYSGKK